MLLINRFERSCDTFGKGKKPNIIDNIGSICPKRKKKKEKKTLKKIIIIINNHGVDVNIIIII
jgi:hypothetical protein